jgi:hypothetical protein
VAWPKPDRVVAATTVVPANRSAWVSASMPSPASGVRVAARRSPRARASCVSVEKAQPPSVRRASPSRVPSGACRLTSSRQRPGAICCVACTSPGCVRLA